MTANPAPSCIRGSHTHGYSALKRCLRVASGSGFRVLPTMRINAKCVLIMTLMCLPSLLLFALLTLPGLIFQAPYQHAFFYFSRVLDQDTDRLIVLGLAGACTLMSLAIPTIQNEPRSPIRD
jgi:hypothetical protein